MISARGVGYEEAFGQQVAQLAIRAPSRAVVYVRRKQTSLINAVVKKTWGLGTLGEV